MAGVNMRLQAGAIRCVCWSSCRAASAKQFLACGGQRATLAQDRRGEVTDLSVALRSLTNCRTISGPMLSRSVSFRGDSDGNMLEVAEVSDCDGGLLLQGSVQVTAINSDGQNYLGTAVRVYPQVLSYSESPSHEDRAAFNVTERG